MKVRLGYEAPDAQMELLLKSWIVALRVLMSLRWWSNATHSR
jgi:hypothetical protein